MKRRRVTAKEVIEAQRRVLKVVEGYLSREKQELLITDGRGLWTVAELRHHVKSALRLKVSP